MPLLINFLAFQIGWFAAVLSAAAQMPWIGGIVISLVIGLHLLSAAQPRAELALLLVCGLLGGVWDSLLVTLGWVAYPSGMLVAGFAPYWIVMMWLLFATTLNGSLAWMKSNLALAAAFGLIGGPLSYLAGQKLGGILLVEQTTALIAQGIGWAIMMPVLLIIADRLKNANRSPNSADLVTE